tara:strand:- start:333 stop:581 length:249 start_codon:yes stop_codon:yes gene_type:complete
MLPKNESYDPSMEWTIVEQSLEEELILERSVREIEGCENIDVLSQLCVAMARQNWHQGKLLKQAVGRIALMDAVLSGEEKIA